MFQSRKIFSVACAGFCLGFLVLLYGINTGAFNSAGRDDENSPREKNENSASRFNRKPRQLSRSNWKEVGGILRPPSDTIVRRNQFSGEKSIDKRVAKVSPVGVSPILSKDLNPNTQSIFEASNTGKYPERLSVMIEPSPFDREKYVSDPEAYLDIVEPGRVFQVKAKGQARPIGESGKQFFELLQGESAVLKATADPGMPVTFYSGKLGQFGNGLATQTVKANEDGVAETTFKASLGTQGEIDIIAGSPTRSGNARFLVKVVVPSEGRQNK